MKRPSCTFRQGAAGMLELAVIADDLTGAADTGIQFRPAFAPVYLVGPRLLSAGAYALPPQALSIFTASRGLPPAEAHRVVFALCRALDGLAPRRIYKKIDSALRGNIGAELEAVMDALNIGMSFIAPAFVEQGRTTEGGVHCIHGTPVAKTEVRRDPVSPVCESRLADWIGLQAHFPVAHVDLAVLNQGPDAAAGAIERSFARGARHFTFDAAAVEHLEHIVHLALHHYPQALLCGSAGLAQSLARALGGGRAALPSGRPPIADSLRGHWLYACGSASEQLRRQVSMLAEHADVLVQALEPVGLAAGPLPECRTLAIQRAVERLAAGDLVVSLAPPSPDRPSIDPQRLVAEFADAVGAVIEAARPAGLFLSGGDTALAILERLGIRAVRLEGEVGSGLVFGRLMGGEFNEMPVVTKAGAFGPPDALLNLRAALSATRKGVRC